MTVRAPRTGATIVACVAAALLAAGCGDSGPVLTISADTALKDGLSAYAQHFTDRTEDVDGVLTHRYQVVVDLSRAATRAGANPRDVAAMTRAMQSSSTPTVELWIDGDGRVRRMTYATKSDIVTRDYSDFGVAVHVATPPASRIADTAKLGGG